MAAIYGTFVPDIAMVPHTLLEMSLAQHNKNYSDVPASFRARGDHFLLIKSRAGYRSH